MLCDDDFKVGDLFVTLTFPFPLTSKRSPRPSLYKTDGTQILVRLKGLTFCSLSPDAYLQTWWPEIPHYAKASHNDNSVDRSHSWSCFEPSACVELIQEHKLYLTVQPHDERPSIYLFNVIVIHLCSSLDLVWSQRLSAEGSVMGIWMYKMGCLYPYHRYTQSHLVSIKLFLSSLLRCLENQFQIFSALPCASPLHFSDHLAEFEFDVVPVTIWMKGGHLCDLSNP